MRLPDEEREELAASLLDSLEPPPGISIEDTDEIERRAAEARTGAAGIPWDEVKRGLVR
jgi:putative addiction module component (TIGR02574 family)